MPNVSCIKEELFKLIGESYTDEQFSDLIMQFGMELDDIVEEPERNSTVPVTTYKIDVGANRGDLLCVEGIARALRVFTNKAQTQEIKALPFKYTIEVDDQVGQIRPYIVSAVIHNVAFNQRSYNSFIDHQDKLHQNVCRRRTLVAIGTHDLKKMNPSKITYTGEKPEDIKFVALNQTKSTNGRELFEILRADKKLGEYLSIIENSPVWPVIRDGNGEVLSLPPIINSEYSKIDLQTTDIFIDCTATDLQKAYIAINAVINGIQLHSSTPLEMEAIKVNYACTQKTTLIKGDTDIVPHLEHRAMELDMNYVRKIVGVNISVQDAIQFLNRMSVIAKQKDETTLQCEIPFQRADVIHPIDLVEDVAISFGYNKIAESYSEYPQTSTIGTTLIQYRNCENIRIECASCGYTEMLLFSLCSQEDQIFGNLDVQLSNPKTSTFTHGRSQLTPGLLRAASCNQHRNLPLQIFECSDVFILDNQAGNDTNASTQRRLAALYGGVVDGFGNLHGLLDKIGKRQGVQYILEREDDKLFIPGRRAKVLVGGKAIGWIGVPTIDVLGLYKIPFPITVFEIVIE